MAKTAERDYTGYADKEPNGLHEAFAEWITDKTGVKVDLKSVQLATLLRMDYQASPENKARSKDAKAERAAAAKEKAAAAKERAAAKKTAPAAKKAAPAAAKKTAPAAKKAAGKPPVKKTTVKKAATKPSEAPF